MARWGRWVRLTDGTAVHVTGSGPAPRGKPCSVCGETSTLLCDYPLGGRRTCSAPLCARCGVRIGPETDYCPHHEPPLLR